YTADGTIDEARPDRGAPAIVVKRRLKQVDAFRTVAAVKTPNAEYGHMALLEVGKGCGRGCRFCLEGQVYRPVRHRSVAALRDTIADLAAQGEKRIGLVGACVSDYPWIGELLKVVEDNGMELSISSLRADSLTDDLVASLARGGHRTLTMAPEAGTERLRRVIRKAITDEQLMAACDLVRARGPAFCTTRERPVGERLPWDDFDVGVKKAGLVREWERALADEPATAGTA